MASEPARRQKRRVKNPETFREKSLKASEANDKPNATSRFKSRSTKFTSPVFRPLAALFASLNKIQPFKSIFKIIKLIGLVLAPPYVRSSWKELKEVTWPNRRNSRQLTSAVLIFAVIFGTVVALVDYGLDKIFRHVLLK